MQPDWSILIPSLNDRLDVLSSLLSKLEAQIKSLPDSTRVQILSLIDNRLLSIGEKRNKLINISSGKYFSFVDDDDDIADDFIVSVLDALRAQPTVDVVTFNHLRRDITGSFPDLHTTANPVVPGYGQMKDGVWEGIPTHWCVWKSDAFKRVRFKNVSWQEDLQWMLLAKPRIRKWHHIDKTLYIYNWDPRKSVGRLSI